MYNTINTVKITDQEIVISTDDIASIRLLINYKKIPILINVGYFSMELTEKNIILVVDTFKALNYYICDEILEYYKTITAWSLSDIKELFYLSNSKDEKLLGIINDDIGPNPSSLLIHDRRMRYQYILPNQNFISSSLIEYIAYRQKQKIWVDSNIYSLSDLIKTLKELHRLPTLIILNNNNNKNCYNELVSISNALQENDIHENIGVYFRLSNKADGKQFNQFVYEKKYNCILDDNINVVIIEYRNLPKFILSLNWKPMSVITVNMNLRYTKVDTYTNQCDLVVNYSAESSIIT